ncbi:MAG TPA: hypothetical protein VGY98_10410, partial [Verrucomicrobiae bacterium]|nr:hypothetical protein [Verrucomicrobiae bacterium]
MAIRRLPSGYLVNILLYLFVAFSAMGAAHESNEKPVAVPKDLRAFPHVLCVGLQWEPAPGSMGYEVQRAPTPFGQFKTLRNNLPQIPLYDDFIGDVATNFYRVRSMQTNNEGHTLPSDWSQPVEGVSGAMNQQQLLTDVQRASFDYFYSYAHPVSGLARASARRDPDVCAIGASGMGLFNLGVGIDRGFITRQEGDDQTLKELRFLSEKAEQFHGAFPHFINGRTGEVIPCGKYDDGADIVETAFLMEGVLFVREYFSGTNDEETEIRSLADSLWRGTEWDWFVNQT